ncbi:MAG: putative guanylate kinase [Candidatus Paceibacter sp.]|jgi:guanylate kinase|nr:putative guanylate kinase [Candidatus Paceibacter sp.]
MNKILVFVGESGSGKTTTINELERRYPEKFKRAIPCTSRKPRAGEVDGIDYNFLPPEFFIDNRGLIGVKKSAHGDYYCFRTADLYSKTHVLLVAIRLENVPELIQLSDLEVIVVRITISEALKVERMRKRGDIEAMITSRVELDASERTEVDLQLTPVITISAEQTVDENIQVILRGY